VTFQLSERVKAVKPSPTLAVAAKAAELKAQGKDVIGLGTGEPDCDTPEFIKKAAITAINAGETKYTQVDGTPALKQAIIKKFKRDNQLDYQPNQILVSCGGKQSFYNLCQALLNPGDEAIIPAPYWVSYPDMVILAGAKPVIIETSLEQHLKISPEQLEKAITPATRLICLNSPSNPTGVSYSKNELKSIADVILKYPNIILATDDMYEHILWSKEPFYNIVTVEPKLYPQTMVLNGVSKAYAMTGWRIGYAAGDKELIAAMKKIQSQSTSNAASPSQAAATAALNGDQTCMQPMVKAFKQRHDYVIARLEKIPLIECLKSDGTFYSFPNIQQVIDKADFLNNDVEFTQFLLEKVGLALVPGSAFGAPGFVRISYAASMEMLQSAMDRLEKAIFMIKN